MKENTSSTLLPVQFHEDTIFCITHNDEPYTPMKPIVENMGLDWRAQATKLRANKQRWGVVIITTPSEGGNQETTCMPVRKLPGYLATIQPNKVKPELREKIIRYQNESDEVLYNYWMKEIRCEAAQPRQLPLSTAEDRLPLRNLVAEWVKASGQSYSTCWKQVSAAFGLAKISELPASWVPNACAWVQDRLDMAQKAIEYQSQNQECQKNDITRDICKAVTDAMQDKKMDEQISIRERVKAAFECKPLPATKTAPVLPESNDILPLEGPTKQNVTERSVIQFLRDGLRSLNAAYQHAGLLVNIGKCPIEGFRRSLYIACMSDINGAAAIVRAMIAAEEIPAAKR